MMVMVMSAVPSSLPLSVAICSVNVCITNGGVLPKPNHPLSPYVRVEAFAALNGVKIPLSGEFS